MSGIELVKFFVSLTPSVFILGTAVYTEVMHCMKERQNWTRGQCGCWRCKRSLNKELPQARLVR